MSYTTPSRVQKELRSEIVFPHDTNPSLDTVNQWISEYDDYVDSRLGFSYSLLSKTEYHSVDSNKMLFLKNSGVNSLVLSHNTSYEGEAPVFVTKDLYSDYTVDEELGIVYLSRNFNPRLNINHNLRTIYNTGSTIIPPRITMLATKLVADRVLTTLFNSNLESRNAGGSISVGSINIVEPADYGVGTWRELKRDIKDLTNELTNQPFKVHRYG